MPVSFERKNLMKQSKYDYKQIISNMYNDILVKHDMSKLPEYFCTDVVVNINGKQFDSLEQFQKRIQWIKQNTKSVHLEIVDIICEQNRASDYHIVDVTNLDGTRGKVMVISNIYFIDNKIKNFVLADALIAGDLEPSVVNDAT